MKTLEEIKKLAQSFVIHKEEAGQIKQVCDKENEELKEAMADSNLKKLDIDGYKVNYIESVREKMNEDKLLELIKKAFYKEADKRNEIN